MRYRTLILLFAALVWILTLLAPVRADVALAEADTFVTVHGGLGGSTSVHGTDSTLGMIGALGSQATPLIKFDLSSSSGRKVVGDAAMDLYLLSSWNNATCTQTIEVHEERSDWNDSGVPGLVVLEPGGCPSATPHVLNRPRTVHDRPSWRRGRRPPRLRFGAMVAGETRQFAILRG